MLLKSRRGALLAAASTVAIACSGAVYAVAPTQFFYSSKGRAPTSFDEAHSFIKNQVYQQLAYAEKFGIKHSDDQKIQIEARIWDHAQYLLSEHYYPKSASIDTPAPNQRGGDLPGLAQERDPANGQIAPAQLPNDKR